MLMTNHSFVSNMCLPSIISKVTNNKMNFENLLDNLVSKVLSQQEREPGNELTVRLTRFQKLQLQSIFIFVNFVHPWLVCISGVTYTFFECFEPLFLCSTKFGGSFYYLNFDKFCDTAPLSLPVRCSAETDGTLFYQSTNPKRGRNFTGL